MKKLLLWWRIRQLKKKARHAKETMAFLLDMYPCGVQMIKQVCPEFATAEQQYNDALRELADIDPTFPTNKGSKRC